MFNPGDLAILNGRVYLPVNFTLPLPDYKKWAPCKKGDVVLIVEYSAVSRIYKVLLGETVVIVPDSYLGPFA